MYALTYVQQPEVDTGCLTQFFFLKQGISLNPVLTGWLDQLHPLVNTPPPCLHTLELQMCVTTPGSLHGQAVGDPDSGLHASTEV